MATITSQALTAYKSEEISLNDVVSHLRDHNPNKAAELIPSLPRKERSVVKAILKQTGQSTPAAMKKAAFEIEQFQKRRLVVHSRLAPHLLSFMDPKSRKSFAVAFSCYKKDYVVSFAREMSLKSLISAEEAPEYAYIYDGIGNAIQKAPDLRKIDITRCVILDQDLVDIAKVAATRKRTLQVNFRALVHTSPQGVDLLLGTKNISGSDQFSEDAQFLEMQLHKHKLDIYASEVSAYLRIFCCKHRKGPSFPKEALPLMIRGREVFSKLAKIIRDPHTPPFQKKEILDALVEISIKQTSFKDLGVSQLEKLAFPSDSACAIM